jgi:tricorn protease
MPKCNFANFLKAILAVLFPLFSFVYSYGQTKLLRYPDIYANHVVFTYASDLWTASTSGGIATRITAHPGLEVFAKFSPDGKYIAFTGQYDGDEQVYVIPATGGVPKQLTFYPAKGPLTQRWGYDNQVLGWSVDGKAIIFRSQRDSWTLAESQLYSVPVSGGSATALPMPEAGSGDFSPDGKKIVYSPRTRDFRSEKRYSGGQANTLYIYDVNSNDAKKISEGERANRDAMWIGNKIYFNSDKDSKFNLYDYDVTTGKTEQVTFFKDWDVRWPSSDEQGQVVYERNGELEILNTQTGKTSKLNISVPDDGIYKRPHSLNVADYIESAALSPKGERVLISARGDIFSVPAEKGITRNLTHSSDAHDKFPRWSPDGGQVAFISDKTGEDEVWIVAQNGLSAPQQLTTGGNAQRYAPEWSSDGKQIVFSDKDGKVFILTVATKKLLQIADAPRGQVNDYEWSPKGNYLAFSFAGSNDFSSVYIYDVKNNKLNRVTDSLFNAYNPTFDPSGDFLYYLSDREFAPQISGIEFNYASNRSTLIYALALRKDVKNPFPAESDEVDTTSNPNGETSKLEPPGIKQPGDEKEIKKVAGKAAATNDLKADENKKNVTSAKSEIIDFDGIVQRVTRVPQAANNYQGLSAKTGHLVYIVSAPFYYGRSAETQPSLRIYSIKNRKESTLAESAGGYSLSRDGLKLLATTFSPSLSLSILDAVPGGSGKNVSTANLNTEINPAEEWVQIFNEVWRRYRDWFYTSNMHGYDWAKLRDEYKTWLPYVAHRADLNYVISEMISELSVQHAYIAGGDFQIPDRPKVALPGARFEADKTANRFRISKIFNGENEEDIYRSPLTETGVDAKVGDYILQINGEEVTADKDIYEYLRNKANSVVTLLVNSTPYATGARTISYKPVTNESNLIYLDWIEGNRKKANALSKGRVGYIHVPDMGANGIREFIKWYYPQLNKEGLVIDVRANGGGNVSRMLIERLSRKILAVTYSRNSDAPTTYPDGAFGGVLAAILNENSASDGDIFPYMFRKAGLGPIIGKRSWGGVVGITNRGDLIDGGEVNVPEFGLVDLQGKWIIEGHGVDPDIEVENEPKAVIAGHDPQLERTVEEILKKIDTAIKLPARPAAPVKTK